MAAPINAAVGGIGLISTIFGGVTQAQGAQQQAQAQQGMYNYQAGVARFNAAIALQNADYARQQGERQAEIYGLKAGQELGGIRAAQSATGLDINTGSAVKVLASQRKVANMDMAQIRANAAKTAYDFDVTSMGFEQQANLYKMAGANAAAAGQINVESSILGTVGSVSSKWLQASQMGLFNPLPGFGS
jgi:hypothetical protein